MSELPVSRASFSSPVRSALCFALKRRCIRSGVSYVRPCGHRAAFRCRWCECCASIRGYRVHSTYERAYYIHSFGRHPFGCAFSRFARPFPEMGRPAYARDSRGVRPRGRCGDRARGRFRAVCGRRIRHRQAKLRPSSSFLAGSRTLTRCADPRIPHCGQSRPLCDVGGFARPASRKRAYVWLR